MKKQQQYILPQIKKIKSLFYLFYLRENILNKIINKNDNKTKNNNIKKALNKWRRVISDSKIENLKGKLLLKIYDKYKSNKFKEAIKKYLKRWENNTIFIDKIATIVNEETTTIYSIKNKKDKIKILLKSIIRNLNRKNNDIIFRKYLNKWKNNIRDRDINSAKNFTNIISELFNNNKNKNGKNLIDK